MSVACGSVANRITMDRKGEEGIGRPFLLEDAKNSRNPL